MSQFFNKNLKSILSIIIILVGIIFISQRLSVFPLMDYVEYWSACRLNLTGGNPYDSEALFSLQKQLGWEYPEVLMMWNPPWVLAYLLPFCFINYSTSRMFWFLLTLFILFISADILWQIYANRPKQRWIALLVMLSFGPTLQALKLGQITPMILLGSVGFLYFTIKKKPFWSGVMASLIFLKPHLLYLFALALLLWSLHTRQWRVLAGLTVGIISPLLIASLPNINLVRQYFSAIQQYPPEDWQTATLGEPLRLLFGPNLLFFQFLPSLLGGLWLVWYWIRKKGNWNWSTTLPLIIVVSIATSSYGWAFDVSVVTFAIIYIAARFSFKGWDIPVIVLFVVYWAVSFFNAFASIPQHYFWWLGSFFLIWYLLANFWLERKMSANPE